MPVTPGASVPEGGEPPPEGNPLRRKLFVVVDGQEVEIRTKAQLDAILARMTPEQLEKFKTTYRFAPIQNMTGITDYTGSSRDI